jgi:hypothetical protein
MNLTIVPPIGVVQVNKPVNSHYRACPGTAALIIASSKTHKAGNTERGSLIDVRTTEID